MEYAIFLSATLVVGAAGAKAAGAGTSVSVQRAASTFEMAGNRAPVTSASGPVAPPVRSGGNSVR